MNLQEDNLNDTYNYNYFVINSNYVNKIISKIKYFFLFILLIFFLAFIYNDYKNFMSKK